MMVYKITRNFPKDEQFGLTIQIRRAAVSITSNLAEGFSRGTYKDKLQFYCISLGSLTELQNQLLIAKDIEYLNGKDFKIMANQSVLISKLCNGLIKKTREFIHNS